MTRFSQLELDTMLKSNTDLQLYTSAPMQAGKTKRARAVQTELTLVSEKLYQERFEYKEKRLSESRMQANFVSWVRHNRGFHPQLASGFAIPNGGYRSPKTARVMKEEGAEAGVSDYMFLCPAKTYAGLVIEFKVKYNKPRDNQKVWLNRLARNGFYCAVCWSQQDAQELTVWFFSLPKGLY